MMSVTFFAVVNTSYRSIIPPIICRSNTMVFSSPQNPLIPVVPRFFKLYGIAILDLHTSFLPWTEIGTKGRYSAAALGFIIVTRWISSSVWLDHIAENIWFEFLNYQVTPEIFHNNIQTDIIPPLNTNLHLSEISPSILLSGVTEYQDSGSNVTPSSYTEKSLYLWAQYFDMWGREESWDGMWVGGWPAS